VQFQTLSGMMSVQPIPVEEPGRFSPSPGGVATPAGLGMPEAGCREQQPGSPPPVPRCVVQLGCEVRIRSDDSEGVVAIVPSGDAGLYRLTPVMPLAAALLGHGVGDMVHVTVDAGTVAFTILAVEPIRPTMGVDPGRVGQGEEVGRGSSRSGGRRPGLGTPATLLPWRPSQGQGQTYLNHAVLAALGWLLGGREVGERAKGPAAVDRVGR
jgi:hypothetical protein